MTTRPVRLGMLFLTSGIILGAILLDADPAGARNPIRTSFFNAYPEAVGTRLDNVPSLQGHCGVCHYAFTGGGPRNPYGRRIEALLSQYPNNDNGRQQLIHDIEDDDEDQDGYSQLVEVTDFVNYANTPTFPGLTPANVDSVSNVDLNDILAYLVPDEEGGDIEAPVVTVHSPNGGENWEGGTVHAITWTATDNVGVTAIDIYYRNADDEPWTQIARGLENTSSWDWHVHNTPSTVAEVEVVARDAYGNEGDDESDGHFTILLQTGGIAPTSLRDFKQPGTQPFDVGGFQGRAECAGCHGGYDPAVEPDHNFQGSMMAQAGRDPLFYACLAVAEQDAPSSGDLCLRCHTAFGWMSGRSNPTDGELLIPSDRDGVSCDLCHRGVDPIYTPGVDPVEDEAILAALDDVPGTYGNGMYVIDPASNRRGPFGDVVAPHPFLESAFHRSSEFCGTCHDVSNPVFERVGPADYAPGPLDEPADSIGSAVLMPLERTYSEWLNSDFPNGVYAPEFAGNKPGGIVSTCQDCHMRDVEGVGCDDPNAPTRPDLPLHDMTGGSTWMPGLVAQLYPDEVDAAALADGAARAEQILRLAAELELATFEDGDSFRVEATITNNCGHKLPTGYPEGRRMWLHLVALDAQNQPVYESGAYEAGTGVLHHDEEIAVYEAHLGISPGLADLLQIESGESFHFALNDSIYKDNRIPPLGFTNADFEVFGGKPVDPEHEGPDPRYADGQNWDVQDYPLPSSARTVMATLYYQSTSKEYVEFLRDENDTNDAGQVMYDLWVANGRAAPVAMVSDTVEITPSSVIPSPSAERLRLEVGPNPFGNRLQLQVEAPASVPIVLEVFDLQGRRVLSRDYGAASGPRSLIWDGRDAAGLDVGSGIYWMRVKAGELTATRRIVRIR